MTQKGDWYSNPHTFNSHAQFDVAIEIDYPIF